MNQRRELERNVLRHLEIAWVLNLVLNKTTENLKRADCTASDPSSIGTHAFCRDIAHCYFLKLALMMFGS